MNYKVLKIEALVKKNGKSYIERFISNLEDLPLVIEQIDGQVVNLVIFLSDKNGKRK